MTTHQANSESTEEQSAKPVVLFLCIHNAGRSQMAAALLETKAGEGVSVISAGSSPANELNPAVVKAMSEIGIDLGGRVPKKLTDEMATVADYVITMGCGDECAYYPGKTYLDWAVDDPAGKTIEEVRKIRRTIEELVAGFVENELSLG